MPGLLVECKQSHSGCRRSTASQGELIKIDVMVNWHSLVPEGFLGLFCVNLSNNLCHFLMNKWPCITGWCKSGSVESMSFSPVHEKGVEFSWKCAVLNSKYTENEKCSIDIKRFLVLFKNKKQIKRLYHEHAQPLYPSSSGLNLQEIDPSCH